MTAAEAEPGCDLEPLCEQTHTRNYAAAFQSSNINICSEGTNSSYLIYGRWQIGSVMVYQPLHTYFILCMTLSAERCLSVCVSMCVCFSFTPCYLKPHVELNHV